MPYNELRNTSAPTPETALQQMQDVWRMLDKVVTKDVLLTYARAYPYGWTESSASNLLTSGAYNGNAGFVGIAPNKCLITLSSTIVAGDEFIYLQRYVSGSYSTIKTLRPGEENSISGVVAGDQLRVVFAMTDTSADVRAYNIQFRIEE